jgi:hypothetical protein
MYLYRLSGVINRENVPEPSAKMLYKLFKDDGKEIHLVQTGWEHDRPLYRKPTEDEIMRGLYRSDEYVQTTQEDGII